MENIKDLISESKNTIKLYGTFKEIKTESILSGLKNWDIINGEEKPNFLENVSLNDESYTVIVDSNSILEKAGEYSVYYKILDTSNNIIKIEESKVVVKYPLEVENITSFIRSMDYISVLDNTYKIDFNIIIPYIETPEKAGSFGLAVHNLNVNLEVIYNLSNPNNLLFKGRVGLSAESIDMLVYRLIDDSTIEKQITNPNWLTNNKIELEYVVKNNNLYTSFQSELYSNDYQNALSQILGFATSMIPQEYLEIFNLIKPLLNEYAKYQENVVTTEQYEQLLLIQSGFNLLPESLNEELLYTSLFNISLTNNELLIDGFDSNKFTIFLF